MLNHYKPEVFATSVQGLNKKTGDATAWLGLGGDLLDLVPIVCNVGETVRAGRTVSKVVDATDDVHDTVKAVDNTASTAKHYIAHI